MKYLFVVALVVAVLATPCTAAQQDQQFADSHLEAVDELLKEMDIQEMLEESIDVTLTMQFQAAPELLQFEDIVRAFMYKYLSWEYLEDYIVQVYAEAFTEEELREITAFYRTETGKKIIELTPSLMNKGMAFGQKAAEEHLPELEQMIVERMMELNSDN